VSVAPRFPVAKIGLSANTFCCATAGEVSGQLIHKAHQASAFRVVGEAFAVRSTLLGFGT
jgi:hypothetical protein